MSEHDAQVALMRTTRMHEGQYPKLALLHANPNGGLRHKAVAARMKAEGQKAGIPDLFLPVARGRYHGLFIELKAGRNKPTEQQAWWMEQLQTEGYYCATCWEWTKALELLLDYLDGKL